MIEHYLLIGSLLFHPILSFILSWKLKTNNLFNKYIYSLGGLSLTCLILLKTFGLSFINDLLSIIIISLMYFSITYLIWNLSKSRKKLIKVVGIISSVIVFGGGVLMGIAGTSILKNKETKPFIEKYINDYRITVNQFWIGYKDKSRKPARYSTVLMYKEFGPLEKLVLRKTYKDTFPSSPNKTKFNYNKAKNHLYISEIENGLTIWNDTIKEITIANTLQ